MVLNLILTVCTLVVLVESIVLVKIISKGPVCIGPIVFGVLECSSFATCAWVRHRWRLYACWSGLYLTRIAHWWLLRKFFYPSSGVSPSGT